MSSPSPYPDHHGIPIDDPVEGLQFYVDGGIATPAPIQHSDPTYVEYRPEEEDEDQQDKNEPTRIIISPVAGTSDDTARISPSRSATWWPQIHVRHDLGCFLDWGNLRALRAASGSVSSTELQDWYQRGQDDAHYFLETWLE